MVVLKTNHGNIKIELDRENAPATVENFLQYVRDGHYDNTVFHRVIDGFMIQGGGMEPGMKQKPTRAPIANEATNGIKNKKYTLAMARTSEPHSATTSSITRRRAPTAGATASSARSCRGRTWSTRSEGSPRATAAPTRTSRRTT